MYFLKILFSVCVVTFYFTSGTPSYSDSRDFSSQIFSVKGCEDLPSHVRHLDMKVLLSNSIEGALIDLEDYGTISDLGVFTMTNLKIDKIVSGNSTDALGFTFNTIFFFDSSGKCIYSLDFPPQQEAYSRSIIEVRLKTVFDMGLDMSAEMSLLEDILIDNFCDHSSSNSLPISNNSEYESDYFVETKFGFINNNTAAELSDLCSSTLSELIMDYTFLVRLRSAANEGAETIRTWAASKFFLIEIK